MHLVMRTHTAWKHARFFGHHKTHYLTHKTHYLTNFLTKTEKTETASPQELDEVVIFYVINFFCMLHILDTRRQKRSKYFVSICRQIITQGSFWANMLFVSYGVLRTEAIWWEKQKALGRGLRPKTSAHATKSELEAPSTRWRPQATTQRYQVPPVWARILGA